MKQAGMVPLRTKAISNFVGCFPRIFKTITAPQNPTIPYPKSCTIKPPSKIKPVKAKITVCCRSAARTGFRKGEITCG